jgi:hypothetical protein
VNAEKVAILPLTHLAPAQDMMMTELSAAVRPVLSSSNFLSIIINYFNPFSQGVMGFWGFGTMSLLLMFLLSAWSHHPGPTTWLTAFAGRAVDHCRVRPGSSLTFLLSLVVPGGCGRGVPVLRALVEAPERSKTLFSNPASTPERPFFN